MIDVNDWRIRTPRARNAILVVSTTALPFLVALAIYAQTINFGYVWDDHELLVRSAALRQWHTLWSAILQPSINFEPYFRPLPLLMLGVEQIFSGGDRAVSHLLSVLLFALNSSLVGILALLLARRWGYDKARARLIGLASALIYTIHPAQMEAVAWISCRFDLLLCFFLLLALIADLVLAQSRSRPLVISVCFACAVLSKEMALGIGLVLPVWHLVTESERVPSKKLPQLFLLRKHIHVYVAIIFVGAAYFLLRAAALSYLFKWPEPALEMASYQHLLLILKTYGAYFLQAAWPFGNLGPIHFYKLPLIWQQIDVVTGVVAVAVTLIALVRMLGGYRSPMGLLAVFAVALIPVSNVIPIPLGDSFMQERFLSMPLIFFCLFIPYFFLKLMDVTIACCSSRTVGLALCLFPVAWLSLAALSLRIGIPAWRNDAALFSLAYYQAPESKVAQRNLQVALINSGSYRAARNFAEQQLTRNNGRLDSVMMENYVWTLTALDLKPSASVVNWLEKNLYESKLGAGQVQTSGLSLAWVRLMNGELNRALALYQRAYELDPLHPSTNYWLAVTLTAMGKLEEAQKFRTIWVKYAHPTASQKWTAKIDRLAALARSRQRDSVAEQNSDHETRSLVEDP